MPVDLIDLVNYQPSNKFFIATPENSDENFIIKGFVSVQMADRDKELVNPAAFDIPSFMAQPAILVNHDLWRNRDGNRVGVGVPLGLHEVKLKSSDRPGMWSVWDVNAKKEIDIFPKDRNPNLGVGSRGLYAFVRLTDPDVIKMVKAGELSGFSWRGLSRPSYVYDEKTKSTYKSYSYIDLVEFSLVTAPNNVGSSFIVAKDAIHSYQFDKSKYSKEAVSEQLLRERLDNFAIAENEQWIYAYDTTRDVNEDGLLVVKMADGASLLLGKPQQSSAMLTQSEDAKESFLKAVTCSKETKMPDPVVTTPPVVETPPTPAVVVAKTTETPPATPAATPAPAPAPAPAATPTTPSFTMDEVVGKTVETVMGKVTPMFEEMTKTVQALAQVQSDMVAKMTATPTPPPAVVEPPKPTLEEVVQKQLAELGKKVESVQKSVAGITPSVPARSEGGTTTPPPKPDPNACFNGMFGIK